MKYLAQDYRDIKWQIWVSDLSLNEPFIHVPGVSYTFAHSVFYKALNGFSHVILSVWSSRISCGPPPLECGNHSKLRKTPKCSLSIHSAYSTKYTGIAWKIRRRHCTVRCLPLCCPHSVRQFTDDVRLWPYFGDSSCHSSACG